MTNNLPDRVRSTLMLKKGEEVISSKKCKLLDIDVQSQNPDFGTVLLGSPGSQNVKRWFFSGYLIITNKRLLFVEQIMGFWGPKDEYNLRNIIELQSIQGMSIYKKFPGGLRLSLIYSSHGSTYEKGFSDLNQAYLNELKGRIEELVKNRIKEIEEEKRKEKVQYFIDFSFLKTQLEKGGIALTTIKCPNCSGNVNVPNSGNFFKCQYCGTTIHAMDIFEKMKGLMENL